MTGLRVDSDREALNLLTPSLIKALFLVAGFTSLVISVALWFGGNREAGLFVGLWVPAIHSLGTLVLVGR